MHTFVKKGAVSALLAVIALAGAGISTPSANAATCDPATLLCV